MKFSQLKIGQRFRYKDTAYTKSGPIQALAEGAGKPQMIMRSAVVELLDQKADQSTGENADANHKRELLQAIDAYHLEVLSQLEQLASDDRETAVEKLTSLHQRLQALVNRIEV